MTAVRIAHADPWPGRTPDGGMDIHHVLVILADDAGHRALPVRLPDREFWLLLSRPDDREEDPLGSHTEAMTGRLLRGAGVTLAGVTVTDLGPGVTVTRIGIAGPGGTLAGHRQPRRRPDPCRHHRRAAGRRRPDQERLALAGHWPGPAQPVPQPGDTPQVPEPAVRAPQHGVHRRPGTRRQLRCTFLRQGTGSDYSATAEDGRAILAAAGPSWRDPPSSPRTSTPATTAVASSPSAANCAPTRRTAAPGWRSASAARASPTPPRAASPYSSWTTRPSTSPPSPEPARGPRSGGRRPDPGGRQPDQVRCLPERPRPGRTPQPATRTTPESGLAAMSMLELRRVSTVCRCGQDSARRKQPLCARNAPPMSRH